MEIINHPVSPQKKKRTFIASMNKYNPYRINEITESVYDKILLNRELAAEMKVESPRDQKTIYLPPVRIEVKSKKAWKRTSRYEHSRSPVSLDSTPKDCKVENFQVLSRSLDFNYSMTENPKDLFKIKRREEGNRDCKASTWKKKFTEESKFQHRTMSAAQDRETSFKIPNKYREIRSPWAFQTSSFFTSLNH